MAGASPAEGRFTSDLFVSRESRLTSRTDVLNDDPHLGECPGPLGRIDKAMSFYAIAGASPAEGRFNSRLVVVTTDPSPCGHVTDPLWFVDKAMFLHSRAYGLEPRRV